MPHNGTRQAAAMSVRTRDEDPAKTDTSTDGEARMSTEAPRPERVRSGSALPPHRWTKVEDPGSEAVVDRFETVIGGGGPAGLTAAYELTRHGHRCVVLEADPHLVGGISRTDQYKGFRFDIGGH